MVHGGIDGELRQGAGQTRRQGGRRLLDGRDCRAGHPARRHETGTGEHHEAERHAGVDQGGHQRRANRRRLGLFCGGEAAGAQQQRHEVAQHRHTEQRTEEAAPADALCHAGTEVGEYEAVQDGDQGRQDQQQ
jgi:hypothetical protein